MSATTGKTAIYTRAWKPCGALLPFVNEYGFYQVRMGSLQTYHPLPARSDCFLEFYFEDRYEVVHVASGAVHRAPRSVLVGPHTRRREDLLLSGHLKVFSIRFSAVGFRALFGIPARLITDCAESAHHVVGASVLELEDRLAGAGKSEWRGLADAFLMRRLLRSDVPRDGGMVARMARDCLTQRGVGQVAELAAMHQLSLRQVERVFQEHVGITPKMFGRLARLKEALRLTRAPVAPEWSDVAHGAGYYDQSHMVREFRSLTGETPVQFVALRQRAASFAAAQGSREERASSVLRGERMALEAAGD